MGGGRRAAHDSWPARRPAPARLIQINASECRCRSARSRAPTHHQRSSRDRRGSAWPVGFLVVPAHLPGRGFANHPLPRLRATADRAAANAARATSPGCCCPPSAFGTTRTGRHGFRSQHDQRERHPRRARRGGECVAVVGAALAVERRNTSGTCRSPSQRGEQRRVPTVIVWPCANVLVEDLVLC